MTPNQHPLQTTSARLDNFSAIVERHQDLVWAIAFAATGNAATSDDLVQETFLAAWKQQADIRELAKIRGYLSSIARNLAYRSLRGQGREILDGGDQAAATPADRPSPLERILSNEKMSQVERGLLEMPSASREPFVLFYLEGSSLRRVAADLDLSESAVKQRLYRARESLKDSVSSQLAAEVARCRPALGPAIFALILSHMAEASAAGAGAAATISVATSSASTTQLAGSSHASATQLAGSSDASATFLASSGDASARQLAGSGKAVATSSAALKTGFLGGGAIALASKAGAVISALLLGLLLISLLGEAGASAPTPQVPLPEQESQAMPATASLVQQPAPALDISGSEDAPPVEGLSDQPLITGRLRLNHPGVDANEDGIISEEEVEEVRSAQGELLLSLIEEHWADESRQIGCSTVGIDAGGVYEGRESWRIMGLREDHAQDIREGVELSVPEWIASRVVAEAREGRICYNTKARFTDDVKQLKVEFKNEPIAWSVSATTKKGNKFYLGEPPQELARELVQVADNEMARAFVDRWGVWINAYKNDANFWQGPGDGGDPESMHRHPVIEALAAEHDEKREAELAANERRG